MLARNASFAHEALAKPLGMVWLGALRGGGELAASSGPLLSHPKPERRWCDVGFDEGIHEDIELDPFRGFCSWDWCIRL